MDKSLNILFVTPYVPSSVRVRPYAFIRELAQRGHQVTLVCLVQPEWEATYLSEISPYCQSVHPVFLSRFEPYLKSLASLPTREPLSVAYCRSNEFSRLVEKLAKENHYDVIHTEFVRAAQATLNLNGNGSARVFDAVDSLTLAYQRSLSSAYVPRKQRIISLLEWLKMRRFEPRIMSQFDHVIVSSPADGQTMERSHSTPITVLPNGVDMQYFSNHQVPRDSETILFLGKMSYYVNVASVLWFYHQVLPLVRQRRPNVTFRIVGRNPSPQVKALDSDPHVHVTGTVTDVRPYLAQATLSVCPMISGSGIQNKMLEAMSVGLPTVATSLACHALDLEVGHDALVADTEEDFADSILRLLDEPEFRRHLAVNGRQYVERNHNWNKIGDRLEIVYADLLNGGYEG